jgi:hypothetical protein
MRVAIEIYLRLRADSVDAASACVDAVLDNGDFQDAINEYANDCGYDVFVESVISTAEYPLVPLPKE